jgi:hypothetical protein
MKSSQNDHHQELDQSGKRNCVGYKRIRGPAPYIPADDTLLLAKITVSEMTDFKAEDPDCLKHFFFACQESGFIRLELPERTG